MGRQKKWGDEPTSKRSFLQPVRLWEQLDAEAEERGEDANDVMNSILERRYRRISVNPIDQFKGAAEQTPISPGVVLVCDARSKEAIALKLRIDGRETAGETIMLTTLPTSVADTIIQAAKWQQTDPEALIAKIVMLALEKFPDFKGYRDAADMQTESDAIDEDYRKSKRKKQR
jgi:hypothetical protein